MLDKLASALSFERKALALHVERQGVLANNVANADTPGFKARDFDFSKALSAAAGRAGGQLAMDTTSAGHLSAAAGSAAAPRMLYRVPDQPSLDGNTVNMDVERATFADNAVRYETSLTLINNQLRQLNLAMKSE